MSNAWRVKDDSTRQSLRFLEGYTADNEEARAHLKSVVAEIDHLQITIERILKPSDPDPTKL